MLWFTYFVVLSSIICIKKIGAKRNSNTHVQMNVVFIMYCFLHCSCLDIENFLYCKSEDVETVS